MCETTAFEVFHWMYPGTYQPLQPLSILLADLLKHPYSDEAEASRGLVDAAFELYQVDQGLISLETSDRHQHFHKRHLTNLGREAWLMLLRTRKKALEQTGFDPHVLLPSRTSMTGQCVCGEKVWQPDLDKDKPPTRTVGDPATQQTRSVSEPLSLLNTPVIEHPIAASFDWEEWDSLLGNVTDIFS
jgi:hypothetical protein